MSEHGRGLDGRTIARGRHGQSGELRLGRRRGVAYEVHGYKQGWADGQADSPNRAKIALART